MYIVPATYQKKNAYIKQIIKRYKIQQNSNKYSRYKNTPDKIKIKSDTHISSNMALLKYPARITNVTSISSEKNAKCPCQNIDAPNIFLISTVPGN